MNGHINRLKYIATVGPYNRVFWITR